MHKGSFCWLNIVKIRQRQCLLTASIVKKKTSVDKLLDLILLIRAGKVWKWTDVSFTFLL